MAAALVLVAAYLVGSIPFGCLFVRAATGRDLRACGSHGTGAINAARAAGVWVGLATLLADAGKAGAVIALSAAAHMPAWAVAAAGFAVMLGHAFSFWLLVYDHSPGEGKAVACALGIMLGLACTGVLPWRLALLPLGIWLVGLVGPRALTGRWHPISPAAMLASLSLPVVVWAAHAGSAYRVLPLAMAALILVQHRNNIRRLLAGTEPRLGDRLRLPADGAR